jgi:hypothetical protein
MKRLFFVLLFALTALVFTGCSSSDDDNGGSSGGSSGGGTPPAPETVIPSPDIEVPGISKSSYGAARFMRYYFPTNAAGDKYFDTLQSSGEGWNCSGTSTSSDDRNCNKNTTIDGESYSISVYTHKFHDADKKEPNIRLEISHSGTDNIPSESLFDEVDFHLEGAAEGRSFGYEVSYSFTSSSDRSKYQDAYIDELEKAGVEEDKEYKGVYSKVVGGSYYDVEFNKKEQPGQFILTIVQRVSWL